MTGKMTLKMFRAKFNLTQDEVALKLNISPAAWSKWENGKSYPYVPHIKQIELLFNISYADIKFIINNTV